MEICRACLLTEQDMIPLDEFCVKSYAVLTNIEICLGDEKPQFFCQNCFNMIKVFMDFREKAISSNAMLQDISENSKPVTFAVDTIIKDEIDHDNNDDDYALNDAACNEIEDYKEVNVFNVPVETRPLQCVLCLKEFPDTIPLLEHLRDHKRGAKCKLCLEKVVLADLYAHTLKHLHHMTPTDQGTQSQPVKLEVPDEYFVDGMNNLYTGPVKAEKKTKYKREKISDIKCKKESIATDVVQQNLLHCGLCKMKFDCKELLTKHLDGHKYAGVATCKLCLEAFSAWPQLFGHRFAHLPPKQRRCHVCARRCFSENQMEFHYRNEHYDGDDKFLKCKQCHRTYANSRKLSKHIRSVHAVQRFVCDHCNKSCTSKPLLISHIASHGGGKRYVCDICDFSCNLKAGLRSHRFRHYPNKIICKICDRIFLDQAKAEEHKLNCKPKFVICPECGKQFSKRKSLTRHLISHQAGTFKCDRCLATFRHKKTLQVHLDRHDGNRTQRCEYCNASFYSLNVLIKHRRVHTGEKPYVCKICHKGFTGNHNLKVHMRIHGEDLIVKKNTLLKAEESPLFSGLPK